MKKGKVYIVGCGPMSETLVTQGAIECIKEADVVLYDRLINESILQYASPKARNIFVGKSREAKVSQKTINSLLVKYAGSGKVVTRLKGGDPFLFGRGGEEAEMLKKAGIKFEVVNGVSSSFACPAYAGIPLTFRGISSAVTIITGQEDPYKKDNPLDWDRVFSPCHTLVVLMGLVNFPDIVKKLIEKGASPLTPAAIIQEGTTPYQKVIVGKLNDIISKMKDDKLSPPCVAIIGKVVNLRKKLNWFRERTFPLEGKNILFVSTKESFYRAKSILEKKGARVFFFEGMKVESLRQFKDLDSTINSIDKYESIVFTSKNAVRVFVERLREMKKDARVLARAKIIAIGPQTAEELKNFLIEPDIIPRRFSSLGLIDVFRKINVKGESILLVRGDRASSDLPSALSEMGTIPKTIKAYRLKYCKFSSREIKAVFDKKIDMIVFASSENVRSFFQNISKFGQEACLKNITMVSLGKPTAETLRKYGFKSLVPKNYTFNHLTGEIIDFFKQ